MRWPHKKPILIDGLDLQTPHLVVLTSDGKRIQSFRFKFSEYYDARLCMSFDGYEGVQLGNRTVALWCKVKQDDCWRKIVITPTTVTTRAVLVRCSDNVTQITVNLPHKLHYAIRKNSSQSSRKFR